MESILIFDIGGISVKNTFSEVKLFQVKPDRLDDFEKLIVLVAEEQKQQTGCIDIKYLKRFYIFDNIKEQPRELTKIVKCVKYYSYWEFDTLENYSNATHWFFDTYSKEVFKLLIMPFDINCGNSIY
ncbi:hypothetical protein BGU53_17710 [Clostridioides difficile]|nr:hypothetical protein [Clostridioides difficile]PBE36923.1 hypothetical protein BGU20_17350 [Clostridioides difficile]PBG46755.1 hypothetical protein BGU93_17275 [Clostridioides difficile]PBH77779.1 hypothetical protein BGU53_17710 [Clostridioides difficile]PBI17940.1 hypothetical protein BGU60_16855 [Clostridioides difficile]